MRNINIDEIDEIEVIKDASAAVFGMKGANGAILIMTKRGEITRPELVRNVVRVSPLGYQRLKRFYPSVMIPKRSKVLYRKITGRLSIGIPVYL